MLGMKLFSVIDRVYFSIWRQEFRPKDDSAIETLGDMIPFPFTDSTVVIRKRT